MAKAQGQTFQIGDEVKLRAGGPKMQVEARIVNDDLLIGGNLESAERYRCQWFVGGKLQSGVFPVESLVKAEEKDGKEK